MIRQTLGPALLDPFTRWRLSLVVLAIIGLPLALPFVVTQAMTALALTSGADPIMRQQALWIMAAPETMSVFVGAWLLYFGPWALGIWGASMRGGLRLGIGWECYGRYLVVVCCVAVALVLDGVVIGLTNGAVPAQVAAEVLSDCAALYILFRLAPAGAVVRAGGLLDLRATWRSTAPTRWQTLRLAVVWVVLVIVIATMAEVASVSVSFAVSGVDLGQSMVLLWILLGAPGLVGGVAAAYVMIVSIALFWRLAGRAPDHP